MGGMQEYRRKNMKTELNKKKYITILIFLILVSITLIPVFKVKSSSLEQNNNLKQVDAILLKNNSTQRQIETETPENSPNYNQIQLQIALENENKFNNQNIETTINLKNCRYTELNQNQCTFNNFPKNSDVYVVASYKGSKSINMIIDDSGENGLNDVVVNVKDKPVFLVLSAYEPIAWRIKRTPETNIAGIILAGYHNQAVIGIPQNVPILNYTYKNRTCGYFYINDEINNQTAANIQKIAMITGKKPSKILYNYDGEGFYIGQALSKYDKLIYSEDCNLSAPKVDVENTSGSIPANIRLTNDWKENATVYLVNNNFIKKANFEDITSWENKAKEPYRNSIGNNIDEMRIEHDMSTDHTYVVLKTFKIPNDFCYGHFINFIIPNGVSAPENKQNCGFYFLKDGSKM